MKCVKKETNSSFLEVVSALAKKIRDPLLALAFGICIIIGLITILTGRFPDSAGFTFIVIFSIATIYFLITKKVKIALASKRNKKRV